MGMKNLVLPKMLVPFRKVCRRDNDTVTGEHVADQTLAGRIDISVQAQSVSYRRPDADDIVRRAVHVDLEGSEFGVGEGLRDDPEYRGFYIEHVSYQVWLQHSGERPDVRRALNHWQIAQESPNSSNMTGSISSSISFNLSASGGLFGDTPTGNVGGGVGFSSSHSHTLNDFTFYQASSPNVLNHRITMTMTGDGTRYSAVKDMFDLVDAYNPFDYHTVHVLPGIAKSNLPLIGQAVFMTRDDAALDDVVTVHVAVQPRWMLVQLHRAPGDPISPPMIFSQRYESTLLIESVDVDFALLG